MLDLTVAKGNVIFPILFINKRELPFELLSLKVVKKPVEESESSSEDSSSSSDDEGTQPPPVKAKV